VRSEVLFKARSAHTFLFGGVALFFLKDHGAQVDFCLNLNFARRIA
jgi:hypothetical protein